VPTFNRIALAADLPPIGAHESPTLDFKGASTIASGANGLFDAAKDIASMASAYGGVLMIGAIEDSTTGELSRWRTMTQQDAQAVRAAYEQVARDRCVPVPLVDPVVIPHPAGDYVVAVNIFPVLHQPVAVKTKNEPGHGRPVDTWFYAVRLSTHAIEFKPDQLAMLMNPQIRRILILLENIPASARNNVLAAWVGHTLNTSGAHMATAPVSIVKIDLDSNALHLKDIGTSQVDQVPLDDVETVWETQPGQWCVRLSGKWDSTTGRTRYVSRSRP